MMSLREISNMWLRPRDLSGDDFAALTVAVPCQKDHGRLTVSREEPVGMEAKIHQGERGQPFDLFLQEVYAAATEELSSTQDESEAGLRVRIFHRSANKIQAGSAWRAGRLPSSGTHPCCAGFPARVTPGRVADDYVKLAGTGHARRQIPPACGQVIVPDISDDQRSAEQRLECQCFGRGRIGVEFKSRQIKAERCNPSGGFTDVDAEQLSVER